MNKRIFSEEVAPQELKPVEYKKMKIIKTKKACFACRKSHRKCNEKRPCFSCLRYNKECFDNEEMVSIGNTTMMNPHSHMHNRVLSRRIGDENVMEKKKYLYQCNSNMPQYYPNSQGFGFNNVQHFYPQVYDTPATKQLKNQEEIKKTSNDDFEEIDKLKKEIAMIQEEIHEIDHLNLPEEMLSFDPVQLFCFQENYVPPLSIPITPFIGRKSGSMFLVGQYKKNILPNSYNHDNFIINSISENASLPFGLTPPQMIGSLFQKYSIGYNDRTLAEFGLVKKKKFF